MYAPEAKPFNMEWISCVNIKPKNHYEACMPQYLRAQGDLSKLFIMSGCQKPL